jgi:hypothetical protein
MPKKAAVRYRSLRSNLVHLPLSLFASLAQQQAVSYSSLMVGRQIAYSLATSRSDTPPYTSDIILFVLSACKSGVPRMVRLGSSELSG